MGEYDSAVALARRLLKKKGRQVTLRGFNHGAPADPSKPWKPAANTPVDSPVFAVFLDYEQKYIDGTTIRTGDQRVFMSTEGVTLEPQQDGLIVTSNGNWTIVKSSPLAPGEQVILYELQVRQ